MRLLAPPSGASLSAIATNWSHVRGLDDPTDAEREAKWRNLCAKYQPAMERYARRVLRRGSGNEVDADEVADVVQGFLAACVEKRWLSRANPALGRFRAFLQTLLKRYSYDYLDHRNALRRRPPPGSRFVPVEDIVAADAGPAARPRSSLPEDEDEFDRSWVETTVAEALARLRKRNARYAEVIDRLIASGLSDDHPAATPPGETRVLRHRARRAFRQIFEEVLRSTVLLDAQVAEEWASIARFLP